MSPLTDEQIKALRAEAAAAGDNIMVAICDVALADTLGAEIPLTVDEVGHMALERRGIYVANISASDQARAECERVITNAEAQKD